MVLTEGTKQGDVGILFFYLSQIYLMLVKLTAFANKDQDQEKNSNIKNENIYRNNRWDMLHCFEIVKVKVKKNQKKNTPIKAVFEKHLQSTYNQFQVLGF